MYLKKMTVEGFKSFGEKLPIELHKGLTVVVGPNGSGKSNILDAIKWVFGTRSLKDIRIDEIKNILFHGVNKNAHFAQVEAVLGYENDTNAEDTTIGRRLYEDGTYEYYLNGQLVRLKDVKEFITKNAAAFTDYSLFEQNNVDAILKVGPRERSKFFEEIAGLSYYRLKYEETLKTLEKVNDKFTPLEKKINDLQKEKMSLQKEAAEMKEYLRVIDGLKNAKKNVITLNLCKMYSEENNYKSITETLGKELLNLYESLINGNIGNKSLKEKLYDIRNGLDSLNQEITQLLNAKDKNFETLNAKQVQYQQFKEEFNKIIANQGILNNETLTIKEKISLLNGQKISIEMNIMSLNHYINNLDEVRYNLVENKNTVQEEVKNCEEKILEINWEFTNINNEINRIEEDLKRENYNLQDTLKKINSKNNMKDNCSSKLSDLESIIKNLNAISEQEKVNFKSMESRMRILEDNKIKKQTEGEYLHSEIEKLKSEKEEIIRQIENEEKGLKEYLQAINQSGTNSELLFNTIELEESVSDDMLRFIGVFENSILCRNKPEIVDVTPPVNVFFVLPSQVNEEQKNNFLNFLQNNSIRCKDENYIDNLYTIFNYYLNKEYNLFMLDSKLFVKLGQATPKITNLHYMLIRLNDRAVEVDAQIQKNLALLSEYENEINELGAAITESRTKIYEVNVEIQNRTKEYDTILKEQELINNEIEYLNNAVVLMKNKINNLSLSKDNTLKQKVNLEELLVNVKNEYNKKLELLNSIELEFDDLYRKLEELKSSKNGEQSKLASITSNINECNARLHEIDGELSKIQKLRAENEGVNKKYEDEIRGINRLIDENNANYQALNEYKSHLCEIEKQCLSGYEVVEEQIKKVKKLYDEKKMEFREVSFRLESIMGKITELRSLYTEEFKEEFNMDLVNSEFLNIGEDETTLKQRIKVYEDKLSTFKNINASAIDKLGALESELASLESEYAKLSAVISELSIFLNNLETEASTIFEDTVKSVSESFNKYVRKLFGGGKAQVHLVKSGKDKEYEVYLNVQIPNKNVKLIESFSSGERTLVSLALLFSFLELKPSPFYVLDEIDASLDDNNLSKLLVLLKEISYNQQIIMISHNKHTLNIADYIIGVTLGDCSYTRILGIDLEKALTYAVN